MKQSPPEQTSPGSGDTRKRVEETLIPPELQLRDVDVGSFRLRTWDTGRCDRLGKHQVGYEFLRPDGRTLFRGEDFACSPLHAIDSDECLRGILGFLTLRPGDTDTEYFEAYTPEQMEFAENEVDELPLWATSEPETGSQCPFRDWGAGPDEDPETLSEPPRIYVACLAAYNAGRLHGRWIDADQVVDTIRDEITAMLADSPEPLAEEYAIHDYENWHGLELHEYENVDQVAVAAQLVAEHGPVFTGLVGRLGGLEHLEEAREAMKERYHGEYDDLEHWAEDFVEQIGLLDPVPEALRGYFDYGKYARDYEMNGDIFTVEVDGKVHVFWSQ